MVTEAGIAKRAVAHITRLDINYQRMRERMDGRERISFLHIGKAAGTQIGYLADAINGQSRDLLILKHGHSVRFGDLPKDRRYFFSIRSPVSRFKSGFYSRKRKGLPRNNWPWTPHERIVFEEFDHANDLAEALFENTARGGRAAAGMTSIRHTAMNQIDWFKQAGHFLELRPPIMIIRQEHFRDDLDRFVARIGYRGELNLATDSTTSHANDYSAVPELSGRAKKNLEAWYRQDMEFYRLCESWIHATEDDDAAETAAVA